MIAYKISKEATKDLENIWLYTYETWSIQQADRYYNLIINEIEFLATYPTSGKECGHIREGYFRSKVYHILSSTELTRRKMSLKL